MTAKLKGLLMCLFMSGLVVLGADENDRFKGGDDDGGGQTVTDYSGLNPQPSGTCIIIR